MPPTGITIMELAWKKRPYILTSSTPEKVFKGIHPNIGGFGFEGGW